MSEIDGTIGPAPVLSPRLLQELALHNPLGPPLPVEDVQAWWDWVWPRFSAYQYTERGRLRAVVNWWYRVRAEEIEAARERLRAIADAEENARLAEIQQALHEPPSATVTNLFARIGKR